MPRRKKQTPENTISSQLRNIIKARRLSAYELGALADVDRSIITRFLSGETLPSLANIDRIAGALRLTLEDPSTKPKGRKPRAHEESAA